METDGIRPELIRAQAQVRPHTEVGLILRDEPCRMSSAELALERSAWLDQPELLHRIALLSELVDAHLDARS